MEFAIVANGIAVMIKVILQIKL